MDEEKLKEILLEIVGWIEMNQWDCSELQEKIKELKLK